MAARETIAMISYEVPRPGDWTSIKIYNVRGQLVQTLVDAHVSAGHYSAPWDLQNDSGHDVAPGVYFCRMEAGCFRDTVKMVVLR